MCCGEWSPGVGVGLTVRSIEQGKHRTLPPILANRLISLSALVELTISNFIANDCVLSGGFVPSPDAEDGSSTDWDPSKSILLVTGPNGSGKSSLLKTIALIVVLAQVGSFVPASSAVIGLCDAIFTRVASQESASKAASAFLLDCNQVSFALRNCTARSLLVMDEFGKGTEANDGTGLFAGLRVLSMLSGSISHLSK
jgi:DNA mismatch repair protein MSH5